MDIVQINTASFDFVTEGSLYDMLMDKKQMSKLKSKHKLRYACQIAKSLSDLQALEIFKVQPQWRILILQLIKNRVTILAHLPPD